MKFREKSLIINKLLLAGQYVLNLVDIGSDLYIYNSHICIARFKV